MANDSELKAKEEQAIYALLEMPSFAAAAEKIGVNESTLRRWRAKPSFQQALTEARREAYGRALCRIQAGVGKAVDALLGVFENEQSRPSERISAARTLLEHAHRAEETLDLRERIAALEQALEERAPAENLQ